MRPSMSRHALWLAQLLSAVCARNDFLIRRAANLAAATATAVPATSKPSPISVSPSANWEGDDGPWSSFAIAVGTPAQDVRVFISTASQGTWVVLPNGCVSTDTSCPTARGGTVDFNSSTTWHQNNYYRLPNDISVTALFGNDTLSLGVTGRNGPSLPNQVIAGMADPKYYLGMLGVNQKPLRLANSSQPSYISSLKDQKIIPSLSFGFTAGAPYRLKKVLGSLTLGGYDQSRFTPNDLSFDFAQNQSRDLVVGIQSIVSTNANGTSSSLLPSGIPAYIDSTVAGITLPTEACQAFERAFGLTYDEKRKLYPVDDALHPALLEQNASVTFTIGQTTAAGGKIMNITLPYASFDLKATPPFVNKTTNYFPLQRANDPTQYTLGRTFLQEAYLIVDWERSNFSLSQCLFIENSQQKFFAIDANSANGTSSDITATAKSSSNHGKTIGIAVGVTIPLVVIACIFAVFVYLQRKKRPPPVEPKPIDSEEAPPLAVPRGDPKELDAEKTAIHELPGGPQNQTKRSPHVPPWVVQNDDSGRDQSEMGDLAGNQAGPGLSPSEPLLASVHEMHGSQTIPFELQADSRGELAGSPVIRKASSGGASSLRRRSLGFLGSRSRSGRSSAKGSVPSPAISPASRELQTSSKRQSMASPPEGGELFSPISPTTAEEETSSTPAGGLYPVLRSFSHSSRTSSRRRPTPNDPQERHGNDDSGTA